MKKIVMILADGFEEIECVTVCDVLRRLGCEVVLAGLEARNVHAANGLNITADALFSECTPAEFDAVALPGGMPGSMKLRASAAVEAFIKEMNREKKIVAAICAAPIVLAKAGLLDNDRRFTMYPGFDPYLDGRIPTGNPAEIDGNIVTGKGPGASFAFAAALAMALGLDSEVARLYEQMFVKL